jgi:hypothetical protein
LRVACNACARRSINELIGVTGLDAERAAFVESSSAVNAVVTDIDATAALSVAGLALTGLSEIVERAGLEAGTIEGRATDASGAVLGVDRASDASGVTCGAVIDGGLVKAVSAVEGADSTDHNIGTLVVTGTVVEDLAGRAT